MKKTIILLVIIVVLGVGAYYFIQSSETTESPVWQKYENSRFGFSVDYPGSWTLADAPTNNDGREFNSPDGDMTCRAYGFNNSLLNDQNNPQTLSEFVDWLSENMEYEEVLERNNTTMDSIDAQELVTLDDGMVGRGVYVLGEVTGMGLVCTYPTKAVMEEQNENFATMQQSFTISTQLDGV